jgi:hypothetical protein
MLVLVLLAVVVFARGLRGVAVDAAVFDAAVVGWLGGIDVPGFQGLMRGLAALSSWWVLNPVAYGLVIVLLVLRRFRHMVIWLVVANLLAPVGGSTLGRWPSGRGRSGSRSGRAGAAGPCRRCTSPSLPSGW